MNRPLIFDAKAERERADRERTAHHNRMIELMRASIALGEETKP